MASYLCLNAGVGKPLWEITIHEFDMWLKVSPNSDAALLNLIDITGTNRFDLALSGHVWRNPNIGPPFLFTDIRKRRQNKQTCHTGPHRSSGSLYYCIFYYPRLLVRKLQQQFVHLELVICLLFAVFQLYSNGTVHHEPCLRHHSVPFPHLSIIENSDGTRTKVQKRNDLHVWMLVCRFP